MLLKALLIIVGSVAIITACLAIEKVRDAYYYRKWMKEMVDKIS